MTDYHVYSADISPFAQRVVMQLEIKGVPFTQSHPPGGFASDEYGAINPIRRMPVLRVGDRHLPESEVICEYLEQVHPEPSLIPEDPAARANGRLLSRIADTYIMNPMMPLFKNLSRKTRNQDVVDLALANIGTGLRYLDHWIAPARYANEGRLTLTDLAVAPILRYAAEYPPIFGMKDPFAALPNVGEYHRASRKDEHLDRGISRIEAGWAAIRAGHGH